MEPISVLSFSQPAAARETVDALGIPAPMPVHLNGWHWFDESGGRRKTTVDRRFRLRDGFEKY